ncbi:MAG: RICIN domain-containing protein [Capsulimonas sp.]|uniref:RICIN domain-containing protein n=1 Tax=Capsulimonas sp. TaxID=2494211 RepID=UPI003265FA1E
MNATKAVQKSVGRICLTLMMLNLAAASHAALTWSWVSVPSDPNINSAISNAMNTAVGNYNTYANYSGNIAVTYNSGVPTAQTDGYGGWIEFGGSINARVAEHEISHWLGTGTYSSWNNFRNNGAWTGANALARVQQLDGPSAVIGCDAQHYWPYGANYDNEPTGYRHIAIVGALRADMGLSDTTKFPYASGTYRLQNRADSEFLDNLGGTANGSGVYQWSSGSSPNQKWVLTAIGNGYYKLSCVTGGLYLDTVNNTADGSSIGQWQNGGSWNQQWALTPADSGYFNIVCRASGKCVDNYGVSTNGAPMVNWGWWWGQDYNQQWRLTN